MNEHPALSQKLQFTPAELEHLRYLRHLKPARTAKLPHASRGERIADRVTEVVGSWRFILIQSFLLTIWISLNIVILVQHWDPYPFILLNLALSFQAAYATPFILMSQNRQSVIDRAKAQQDLDCDLKAEMEIELLHYKLDTLREREIAELNLAMQRQYATIQRLEILLQREISTNHPSTETATPTSLGNNAEG